MAAAHPTEPMIQANCRDRFTADDFQFVVGVLSRRNAVSLTELLTDAETRDTILDHEQLMEAILCRPAHLPISPQFYFYVLSRHVLKSSGIDDRRLTDYIASLLEAFSRTARLRSPGDNPGNPTEYLSDMLLALRNASPAQTFLLRAHVGNYSLFLSGIFFENVQRRSARGAPDFSFYEEIGRSNYKAVARHQVARSCELTPIYEALADQFHEVRVALNHLSERLLNWDDDAHLPTLG
jgi:hypothetical protein